MNHNDDKVKDLLENVEIPDEISPENMKKMLDEGIIYPIQGKGKGKYLFRRGK